MRWLVRGLVSSFIALLFAPSFAWAAFVPPAHVGYINDQAHVFTDEERMRLEQEVQRYERETSNEIGVLTLSHLPDDTPIEDAANAVFRAWGIGKKEKNNGVLFLVAVDDRLMRIEVGYGLEGDLTDIETKHIQDQIARPAFRAGNYAKGIEDTVRAIEEGIGAELPVGSTDDSTNLLVGYDPDELDRAAIHILAIIGFIILETIGFFALIGFFVFLPRETAPSRRKYGIPLFFAWMIMGIVSYYFLENLIVIVWSFFYGVLHAFALRNKWHVSPGQLSSSDTWTTGSSGSDGWSSSSSDSSSSSSSSSDFGGGSSGGGGSSSSW